MSNSLITETGRECSKCNKFKLWSEYNRTKATKTGRQARCRACCSKGSLKYRVRKPDGRLFAQEPGFSSKIQDFLLGRFNERNRSR